LIYFQPSFNTSGAGSLALNCHFDPDDSRALYQKADLSSMEAAIESVVTRTCYGGVAYTRPPTPAGLARLLREKQAARDRGRLEDSAKGSKLAEHGERRKVVFTIK
jgi:hypothetical protein